jgi:hypothetical protein
MGDENAKTVRLEVRAKNERGFRRVGRLFTQDPVEDSFTEDAARILMQEPQLIVRQLDGTKVSAENPPDASRPPQTLAGGVVLPVEPVRGSLEATGGGAPTQLGAVTPVTGSQPATTGSVRPPAGSTGPADTSAFTEPPAKKR